MSGTEVIEREDVKTPEELKVEQQEAEAGFASGFKKVSGNEPQKPDDALGDDAATADTAAAEAKAKAEAEATAKAEQEAKAKADAEERAKAAAALGLTVAEIDSLKSLPGQMRNLSGHIGGLKSQIQTVLDASRAIAKTGTDAPSAQQIQAASSETDKWKQLKKDFPEWAEAMDERLASMTPAAAAPVDVSAIKQEVTKELSGSFAALLTAAKDEARQLARIDMKHEGWTDTVKTPEFNTWLKTQAPETQALVESTKAVDAIKLLDSFATHRQSVAAEAAKRQKQEKRLAGAVTPQGTGQPAPATGINDEQAFERGFKRGRGK